MRVRVVILCLVTALLTGGTTALTAAPAASAASRATLEARFVERLNATRARHGLGPLRVRQGLTEFARRHSATMSQQRALFHSGDLGSLCCWSTIAENVGSGFSVRGMHRTFLRSPGHRANLLGADKRAVGVGVVRSGGRIWVTQVFRAPR